MAFNPEKEEYELQHFNFSSEDLIAQNTQMVQSLLDKSLTVFTEQLIQKQEIPEESATRLRACCNKTSIALYNDCLPAMNDLQALFRKTFTIPDNVLLPTDLLHVRGYTGELVSTLEQEVQSAKDAVMQGAVFLASLEAEMELHRELEACYEAEAEIVELLEHFQEQEIDPDDVSDLVRRLETGGIIAGGSSTQESIELDNFLLQKQ
uniref:Protein MIS12 homolog n=1 Tax=Anopheles minimus TaxID=112268 RepID=A0A182WHU6_9DIPT